jgi:hypothetical protein
LASRDIAAEQRHHYNKWLRYYWDFCHKYAFEPNDKRSFPAFNEKLRAKRQSEGLRKQAYQAVSLYYAMVVSDGDTERRHPVGAPAERSVEHQNRLSQQNATTGSPAPQDAQPKRPQRQKVIAKSSSHPPGAPGFHSQQVERRRHGVDGDGGHSFPSKTLASQIKEVSPELKMTGASWVGVFEGLDTAIKVRHYSPKTWQSYSLWIRKFQTFSKSKDPRLLSMEDVKAFLSFLAVEKKVAASTQNQAFNALLFLFRHVLEKEFGQVEGVVRAKRKPYIPVLVSHNFPV